MKFESVMSILLERCRLGGGLALGWKEHGKARLFYNSFSAVDVERVKVTKVVIFAKHMHIILNTHNRLAHDVCEEKHRFKGKS